MRDPFLAQFRWLSDLVRPYCYRLNLYSLPKHIHEILLAALFYHIIFEYLAAPLSRLFLPTAYNDLSRDSKLRWNMHCASMVSSCLITTLALTIIATDTERAAMDLELRIWGYTGAAGLVQAFATGYFLFDLIVMLRHQDVFGPGMLLHAISCVITYTLGFRPVFNYYGCVFVLYELSTPFLNIHWFCDKLHLTGSKLQLYNGIALIVVFFCCRLVWGAYASFWLYSDVWHVLRSGMSNVPMTRAEWELLDRERQMMMGFGGDRELRVADLVIYGVGHVVLQCLNVWWFGKMISAVRKRFSGRTLGGVEGLGTANGRRGKKAV